MKTTATTITLTSSHFFDRRSLVARLLHLTLLALIAAACSSTATATDEPGPVDEPVADTTETETSSSDEDEPVDTGGDEDGAQESSQEPAAGGDEITVSAACDLDEPLAGSRVDILATGNRIAPGSIDFNQLDETEVELPDTGVWVTADPSISGGWYVVLERGSAVRVSPEGDVTATLNFGDLPPEFDSEDSLQSPYRWHELFSDPITDGRVVFFEDIAAVLATPTDLYPHGALGNELEAAAIEWVDTCTGQNGRIEIEGPDVIEGISPMLVDIDQDGQVEIIVTLSNSSDGARLAAFELDGTSAGESEPVGQGNRWRNQLAVGAFGPQGEVEIIDVQTPHIGGRVQAFRQIDDEDDGLALVQVAESNDGYTSHVLGLRNLSMGIAVDANNDEFPDVMVANKDRDAIVTMTRTDDLEAELQGWEIVGERSLANQLTSNIASQEESPGRAIIAVADGDVLRIWR